MTITFTDSLNRTVELSQPNGGGGGYQVLISRHYYGQFVKYQGKWSFYGNNNELTADDIDVLREKIEESE